jgi:hypothetical protein
MAAMGRRKMNKRSQPKPSEASVLGVIPVAGNLTVGQITVEPVARLGAPVSFPGNPIMRDDFITKTGPFPQGKT